MEDEKETKEENVMDQTCTNEFSGRRLNSTAEVDWIGCALVYINQVIKHGTTYTGYDANVLRRR